MALRWNWLAEFVLTRFWVAPLFLLLAVPSLGCGSGVPDAGPLVEDAKRLTLSDDVPIGAVVEYAPRPTVTLYPTFTPMIPPSPTLIPAPTATMVGYLPPLSSPTAALAPAPTTALLPEPTASVVPVPVLPTGGIYGALINQTFFGMHDAPEVGVEMPAWPDSEEVFLVRTTRFLVWYLLFDHGKFDESKVERCLMRITVEVGPPDQRREHVVHQEPVDVEIDLEQDGDVTQVILGLGNPLPGDLWTPGNYRAEFWDSSDRVVAQWEFKVG